MRRLANRSSLVGLARKDAVEVCAPLIESSPALCKKIMALVDGCNSGNGASLVIENFCDMRCGRPTRHPGHARTTQDREDAIRSPRKVGLIGAWRGEVSEGLVPSRVKTTGPFLVARFNTASACVFDRWTMCALAFFVLALGIVQTR